MERERDETRSAKTKLVEELKCTLFLRTILVRLQETCLTRLPFSSAVFWTNVQAHYRDFELRLQANQDKMKTIIDGIKPMLDFIDPELPEPEV